MIVMVIKSSGFSQIYHLSPVSSSSSSISELSISVVLHTHSLSDKLSPPPSLTFRPIYKPRDAALTTRFLHCNAEEPGKLFDLIMLTRYVLQRCAAQFPRLSTPIQINNYDTMIIVVVNNNNNNICGDSDSTEVIPIKNRMVLNILVIFIVIE